MYHARPSDFETKFNGCIIKDGDRLFYPSSFREGSELGTANISAVEFKNQPIQTKFGIELTRINNLTTNHPFRNIPIKNDLFPHPPLGFINHDFYLLRFTRPHQKVSGRYRLGFHRDCVHVDNLNDYELRTFPEEIRVNTVVGRTQLFNNSLLSLFFPTFYSYEDAISFILNNAKLGVAITPTIAIKIDGKKNTILLLKNEFTIGEYSPKSKKFSLRTKLYNKELTSLGIPYEDSWNFRTIRTKD